MTDDTDQALVRGMAGGDPAALAAFYDRHAPGVLGLLRHLLGAADAEDVLQQTFWEAWRRAGQYDPARARPETWLLLIARSRALDLRRSRRPPPCPPAPAGPPDPAVQLERSEAAGRVRAALGALPEEQRRAICLAFFAGLTHEEIARRLGLPLGTVKTRIRLGMNRLRELLPRP